MALTNAPGVFQALVNDIFRGFLNNFVFVYVDNNLIFCPDKQFCIQHVCQVLQRLLQHQLYVKAEKCEFHVDSVSFLGFKVSQGKVVMDQGKVRVVAEWPTPTSRKEVQRFLGFANFYSKFIRNFSSIAALLHALTSSKTLFQWNTHAEAAYTSFKKSFLFTPVLTLPDNECQFIADASDISIGAVIS